MVDARGIAVQSLSLAEDASHVILLDQTRLPGEELYLELHTAEAVCEAIRTMRVRGAPAIGIAAACGVVLGFRPPGPGVKGEAQATAAPVESVDPIATMDRLDLLFRSTRPTAVNLAWALDRMRGTVTGAVEDGPFDRAELQEALVREARAIHEEDREACRRIGQAGLSLFPSRGSGISGEVVVLTHCNAGALATGGIGTALAPVYAAHQEGRAVRVFARETRPLLQGARLTAWELARAGVPVTVLADSAAPSLLASGAVDLIVVGADRVARNGDAANKIGTLGLALAARRFAVPFFVAVPWSTVDDGLSDGSGIPIEERGAEELRGPVENQTIADGAAVWNPAFDVTPADLISGFIMPSGVILPPFSLSRNRAAGLPGPDPTSRESTR